MAERAGRDGRSWHGWRLEQPPAWLPGSAVPPCHRLGFGAPVGLRVRGFEDLL